MQDTGTGLYIVVCITLADLELPIIRGNSVKSEEVQSVGQFKSLCLPMCYVKIDRLKYTNLYYLLFQQNVHTGGGERIQC